MDKIWIVTDEQLGKLKNVAETVYERDFRDRDISHDTIATTDSYREEFVSKCCVELKIRTLSDELVRTLLNVRKSN